MPKNWSTHSTSATRGWLRQLSLAPSTCTFFLFLQLWFNGYDNDYDNNVTWDLRSGFGVGTEQPGGNQGGLR